MTIEDLLYHLTRGFFLALAIVTFINYMRHKTHIRRDIFLMFLCLSINTLMQIFRTMSGYNEPWLARASQLVVIMQPFLMIRLVHYFQPVPKVVWRGTFIGMIICWLGLSIFGSTIPLVTLFIVAYFCFADGYAIVAFVYGAFSSVGVVRHRLQFAAAGSVFLVLILLLGGINVVAPTARSVTLPMIQLFSVCSAISFYFSFAPPRWLILAWKNAELRHYLQLLQNIEDRTVDSILERLYHAVRRINGLQVSSVQVALWDEASQRLILQTPAKELDALPELQLETLFPQVWNAQIPLVIYKAKSLQPLHNELMTAFKTETMLAVPVATYKRNLGIMLVFLQYASLFVEDDLRLLTILAQQTAVLLENQTMLEGLYRHTEELEEKVEERTAALRRSNEELKLFAYIASHDLQEPLRTISSYIQLIKRRYADKLDADGLEFIAFAVDGAARMKELINDVLLYSRIETQSQNFVQFEMQETLDQVQQFLHTLIVETHTTLTSDTLPSLVGDKRLIIQLLQNLISNAIKYRSSRPPEIHVGVTQQGNQWVFSVRDNGIGIEADYLEQIFIAFKRLHTNHQDQGTGIGLAVCKKVVELHGGRIWAESEIGQGTTFYFTMPVQKVSHPTVRVRARVTEQSV